MSDTNDQNPQVPPDPIDASVNAQASEDDASDVWLVSYDDDDDRELRPPQIAEALRLGEINAETIVWRQGEADWLPLAQVPALAKLLPSSGETATAPLVAPNPALLRRVGAKPAQQGEPALKASTPSMGGKPTIGGRVVPTAKGTTKLGIPKFEPKKDLKAEATPLPMVGKEPIVRPAAKSPIAPAVVPDMTPTVPKSPAAPVTPTHSRVEAPKVDIFGSDGVDEEAISIEPEFMRPPSPAPARAMQRAKALSPGTLGMKKPAPPPRPPEKRGAPEPEPPKREEPKPEPPKQEQPKQVAGERVKKAPPSPPRKAQPSAPAITLSAEPALAPDPGTPSLGTLAAPVQAEPKRAQPKRADEGILSAEELLLRALALDPATTGAELSDAPAADAGKPVAEPPAASVQSDDRPTPAESSAPIAPAATRSDKVTDAPVSEGRPPAPAKPGGKNPWPLVAAAGAVVLLGWLFMQGKRGSGAPQPDPETRTNTTEPAAAAPAQPAAPNPATTEAPAPTMTAEIAPAEPPPAEPAPAAAPEKPAPPALAAAVKSETPATPKSTEAALQPAKATAPKAETKPAEAKPPAPAAPVQKEVAVGGEFDRAAAGTALTGAAQEASGCRKEGDPSGVAVVHVTFSNAGRATRAVIEGPPFAGTQTGGCIAATLRRATVPPYGGDRVTVTKKVVIR